MIDPEENAKREHLVKQIVDEAKANNKEFSTSNLPVYAKDIIFIIGIIAALLIIVGLVIFAFQMMMSFFEGFGDQIINLHNHFRDIYRNVGNLGHPSGSRALALTAAWAFVAIVVINAIKKGRK